ncbi:hypothetical protein NM688_g459 [Phlebia brevispora]|uniref:Uncharacterized protein n=1 Tax=Phlebia brevispora TaxID=194682 RepID=A0ACC1TE97_9APHY|nr:hypothetical protein NM688_g459 [Phlebia brevispora]
MRSAITLNLDVVAAILFHVESISDISRTSRASRTFHSLGIASLLRRGVTLTKSSHLVSFMHFLLADNDNEHRALLLRDLSFTIDLSHIDPFAVQILQHAVHLEKLMITDGSLFEHNAAAGSALASLLHLRSLTVANVDGSEMARIMHALHAPCAEVDVSFCPGAQDTNGELDMNLMFALHAATLTRLKLMPAARYSTSGTQYLQATTLVTTSWNKDSHSEYAMEPLMYTFPNLRRLIIKRSAWVDYFSDAEIRQPIPLYALALPCPVKSLVIDHKSGFESEAAVVLALVKETACTRLCVYPAGNTIFQFLDGIRSMHAPALTHLTLFVGVYCGAVEGMKTLYTNLVDLVKTVHLVYLDFRVFCCDLNSADPYARTHSSCCHVHTLDLDALAARIAHASPPDAARRLRYILLEAGSEDEEYRTEYEDNRVLVWQLEDEGGERDRILCPYSGFLLGKSFSSGLRRLSFKPLLYEVLKTVVTMTDSERVGSLFEHGPYGTLNFDVLTRIMACISQKRDLLSIMRTRSDLYGAGIPLLLSFPCKIDTRNLRPFHEFLVSKAPSSFLALRTLYLFDWPAGIPAMSSTLGGIIRDAGIILDIIRKATRLEALTLYNGFLLKTYGTCQAIASLTALRTLNIRGDHVVDEPLLSLLPELQSPVRNMGVDWTYGQDILPSLRNFRHTLQCACFSYVTFRDSGGFLYSRLTTLKLMYSSQLRLSVLAPALPNLQTLILQRTVLSVEDQVDTIRDENIQFQRDRSTPVWKLLSFSTDLEGLYILGLQCSVPRLEVIANDQSSPLEDLEWLRDSLSPLKPLDLIVKDLEDPVEDSEMGLLHLFLADMNSLNSLDLSFKLTDGESYEQSMVSAYQTGPGLATKGAPQEKLTTELACLQTLAQSELGLVTIYLTIEPLSPFLLDDSFLQQDKDSLAHRLMDTVSSLRVVNIKTILLGTNQQRQQRWLRRSPEDATLEVPPELHNQAKRFEDEAHSIFSPPRAQCKLAALSAHLNAASFPEALNTLAFGLVCGGLAKLIQILYRQFSDCIIRGRRNRIENSRLLASKQICLSNILNISISITPMSWYQEWTPETDNGRPLVLMPYYSPYDGSRTTKAYQEFDETVPIATLWTAPHTLAALALVMPYLPREDLYWLRRTCPDLYRAGIYASLAFPLTISNKSLWGFYEFLTSDSSVTSSRFSALRNLRFRINVGTYKEDKFVVDILRKATELETLEVQGSAFRRNKEIVRAIASLKSLRTLKMLHIPMNDSYTKAILKRLQCPLTCVEVGFDRARDVLKGLANFQNTLETVIIPKGGALYLTTGLHFPNLTYLELSDRSTKCLPRLSVLAPALPNLETWIMAPTKLRYDHAKLLKLQKQNTQFQLAHPPVFPRLTFLQLGLDILFALAPQFPVSILKITHYTEYNNDRLEWVGEPLSFLRPEYLLIDGLNILRDLMGLEWIFQQGMEDLRHLYISAYAEDGDSGSKPVPYIDLFMNELEPLSRASPTLLFYHIDVTPCSLQDSAHRFVTEFDVKELSRRIKATVSSIDDMWLLVELYPHRHEYISEESGRGRLGATRQDFPEEYQHLLEKFNNASDSFPIVPSSLATANAMHTASIAVPHAPFTPLNFDLLARVMACIPQKGGLLSFMMTCSDLYSVGVPILLGFPHVIDHTNLHSFHKFLVSKTPSSFFALRDIRFHFHRVFRTAEKMQPADLEAIAGILRNASRLKAIGLHSEILQTDDIPRAIASLTTLQNFSIYGDYSQRTEHMLSQLRSPLRRLELDDFNDRDILPFLQNFRHTLEHADLAYIAFSLNPDMNLHCANLTHLELSICPLLLSTIGTAFPNLRTLVLPYSPPWLDDDETDRLHSENIQFQQRRSAPLWKLSHFSADLQGIYTLGLQFQVPYLTIRDWMFLDEEELVLLQDSISLLRPVHLFIRLSEPSDRHYIERRLSELLRNGMDTLRFMNITTTLSGPDVNWTTDGSDDDLEPYFKQYEDFIDALCNELEFVPFARLADPGVLSLSIRIEIEGLLPSLFVDRFDADGLVDRLMSRIPSLKLVKIASTRDTTSMGFQRLEVSWLERRAVDASDVRGPGFLGLSKRVAVFSSPTTSVPHLLVRKTFSQSSAYADAYISAAPSTAAMTDFENASLQPVEHAPSSCLPLHFDCLTRLMACISRRNDLVSFMCACSDLYTVGVSILLGFPHTITDASLHPFHDFLASKAPSSFLALRNLGFAFRELNAQDARMGPADMEVFLGILRKATRLETLRLSLGRSNISLHSIVPPCSALNNSSFQCVKLTTLEFRISSLPALRLSTIAPAFPNLQSLIVACATAFFSGPARQLRSFRQENIQFQRQHSSPIWRLSHLSADFECLAALGLQFHVPHLTITRFLRYDGEELIQLQDALSVLRPVHLVIRHSGSTSTGTDPYSLPQLFCLSMEALRSFDMCIRVSSCDLMYGCSWKITDKLRDGLGLIADLVQPGLLILSLRVETNHGQLAERYMDKLDKDTLIRQIANKLPTLQVLNFQSRGVRGRRQQHWLRRTPNGGMLEVPPERYDLVERMEDQLYSTLFPVKTRPVGR